LNIHINGGGPSMVGAGSRLLAAIVAKKLWDAGVGCEIVNLVPIKAAVLRRDRFVVLLALALLTALAWSYLTWLSTDMNMGGIDMTGIRMIPSGMGLMIPAHMPWRAMEFAFVFAMWIVMKVGMMTPSAVPMFLMYARVGRQTEGSEQATRCNCLVRCGLFPCLDRFRNERHARAMGV
jgi:Predicted metal-binding integral membrane protein (DUF2182)